MFPFSSVSLKSEDDEEFSQLHEMQSEQKETCADEEGCVGAELPRNSDSETHFHPDTEDKTEESSGAETDDSNDWTETRRHQSGSDSLRSNRVSQSAATYDFRRNQDVCSDLDQTLYYKLPKISRKIHTEEKDGGSSDQEMMVQKEVHTELKQEDSDPPLIKEEQEEVWISWTDKTNVVFSSFSVKNEEDEGKHLQPEPVVKTEDSAETDDSVDSDFWKETRERRPNSTVTENIHETTPKPEIKAYCCSECGKTFKNKYNLTLHFMVHTGEKPFSCSECGKSFSQKCYLKLHLAHHRGEKPFSCSVCGRGFAWCYQLTKHKCGEGQATGIFHKGHLRSHMVVHTGEKPFGCSVCGKRYNHQSSLRIHLVHHRGERPFSCSVCNKRFNQKGDLNTHMRVHTEEKPFSCSVCSKRFNHKSGLKAHMAHHGTEKPFSCSLCNKTFFQKAHLTTHMYVHTGEKPFSCSECGKSFSQKGYLKLHLAYHRGEKPFSCSVCGRGFTWSYQLRKHKCGEGQASEPHQKQTAGKKEQVETGANRENCGGIRDQNSVRHLQPESGGRTEDHSEAKSDNNETRKHQFGFNSEESVDHKSLKTYKKPHRCSDCGKALRLKTDLTIHTRIHTGVKPFSCSVCNKSFSQKGNLMSHMVVHTGEKPYSCSVCGKRYTHKSNLRVHMVHHRGERPFSCSVCNKRFNQKGNLNTHMRVHTKEKPFSCSVCSKRYNHKSGLKAHMAHHSTENLMLLK